MRINLILILALAVACTSVDPGDARQRCADLRDHVVELRLGDVGNPDVDLAAHRAAMQQALGEPFVERCVSELSEPQIHCAMSATESQAVAACSTHPIGGR